MFKNHYRETVTVVLAIMLGFTMAFAVITAAAEAIGTRVAEAVGRSE